MDAGCHSRYLRVLESGNEPSKCRRVYGRIRIKAADEFGVGVRERQIKSRMFSTVLLSEYSNTRIFRVAFCNFIRSVSRTVINDKYFQFLFRVFEREKRLNRARYRALFIEAGDSDAYLWHNFCRSRGRRGTHAELSLKETYKQKHLEVECEENKPQGYEGSRFSHSSMMKDCSRILR